MSRGSRRPTLVAKVVTHVFLVVFTVATVFPVALVVKKSLSAGPGVRPHPVPHPRAIRPSQHFKNVIGAIPLASRRQLAEQPARRAGHHPASGVFLACTAAYAFSRFRFPGHRAGSCSSSSWCRCSRPRCSSSRSTCLLDTLGLLDQVLGLVLVYSTTAIPFCVWMLKGYFDTIPRELEEAARIDGASRFAHLLRHRAAARPPGHRRDRALLVHDRLERVHHGRHLHQQGARLHAARSCSSTTWASSAPPSGARSPPARSSCPSP